MLLRETEAISVFSSLSDSASLPILKRYIPDLEFKLSLCLSVADESPKLMALRQHLIEHGRRSTDDNRTAIVFLETRESCVKIAEVRLVVVVFKRIYIYIYIQL